jgi:hypothetical protein
MINTTPLVAQIIVDALGFTPMSSSDAAITGGAINGSAIGGVTPAAGAFTTLSGSVTATGSTTAQTLAARFGQVANPFDFGAAGNGTTDDTVAIQAAVNSGKPVFFPPGTYLVSSAVVIPQTGVTMFAQPFTATIKAANPFPGTITNGTVTCFVSYAYSTSTPTTPGTVSSDIYADGLSFDLTAWNGTGTATDGLALVSVNNFSITNCFCNGGMSLAQIVGCSNGYEAGNRVVNSQGNSCFDHWGGCQNVRIIGNYLHSAGAGPAININGSDGTGSVAHTTSGFLVEGNNLFGSINLDTLEGYNTGNTSQFVQKIVIQGNNITSPWGIYGRGQATDVKIIGNTLDVTPISGNSPAPGIWIGLGSDVGGGTIGTPDSFVVAGNTIKGFVGSTVNAIQMEGTNSIVSDNITGGAYNLALQIGSGTYYGNIFPNGAYGPTVIAAEGAVVNVTAPVAQSAADALTATGTNLATAFVLTSIYSSFITIASGTWAALPANAAAKGQQWTVWNEGANPLTIGAQAGDSIAYASTYTLAVGAVARFVSLGDGLWRLT